MGCRGVLFALTPEQARDFLRAGSDAEVRNLVHVVEGEWDAEYLQETEITWDAIHRCLSDGTTNGGAGEYPLNHAILGGRHLYGGDDYVVAYVTAQQVREVSDALARVTEPWFRERFFRLTETDFPQEYVDDEFCEACWDYLEMIQEFYEVARDAGRSVIFTVSQ